MVNLTGLPGLLSMANVLPYANLMSQIYMKDGSVRLKVLNKVVAGCADVWRAYHAPHAAHVPDPSQGWLRGGPDRSAE